MGLRVPGVEFGGLGVWGFRGLGVWGFSGLGFRGFWVQDLGFKVRGFGEWKSKRTWKAMGIAIV